MILDTNALSDLFTEPPPKKLIQLLEISEVHHVPVIVLGEFRYGALFSKARTLLESRLDRLIETNIILHVDEITSRVYAQTRANLKKRGLPIPENDLWIAAMGLQHGLSVATLDRHFHHVLGLDVKSW